LHPNKVMCNDSVSLRYVYTISYIDLLYMFVYSVQIWKQTLNSMFFELYK